MKYYDQILVQPFLAFHICLRPQVFSSSYSIWLDINVSQIHFCHLRTRLWYVLTPSLRGMVSPPSGWWESTIFRQKIMASDLKVLTLLPTASQHVTNCPSACWTDWRNQQNHFFCRKQRCISMVPDLVTPLTIVVPWVPGSIKHPPEKCLTLVHTCAVPSTVLSGGYRFGVSPSKCPWPPPASLKY